MEIHALEAGFSFEKTKTLSYDDVSHHVWVTITPGQSEA
jgi:hypothetical protein